MGMRNSFGHRLRLAISIPICNYTTPLAFYSTP
jgi:hypothetical protein